MPAKGAFKRCVESVARKGGATDPRGVCASSISRKRGRTRGRVNARRKNLFGLHSKITYSPTANKKAFKAGRAAGDTGAFDAWFKRQGYDKKGYDRKALAREYERGVESLFEKKQLAEQKSEIKEAGASESEYQRLKKLVDGGMTLRQAADKIGLRINPKGGRRTSGEKAMTKVAETMAMMKGIPVMLLTNKGKRKERGVFVPARKNPGAAEAFEDFHGFPAPRTIEFEKLHHYHAVTWEVGTLLKMVVKVPKNQGGGETTISGFKGARLTANKQRTQLFVEGGDQAVNLGDFGIKTEHEYQYLGEWLDVVYHTNKTHLGKDGGKADYHHKFGQKETLFSWRSKTARPHIIYDVPNEQLLIAGGGYEIPAEGIDG